MKHSALALGLLLSVVGCGGGEPIVEGGIYSIESGERFGIVKILKLEPGIVHLRVYKNKFASRPTSINVEDLSLGRFKPGSTDKDGFGIGHMPIRERDFRGWKPVLLTKTQVTESELEGYKMWKESGGGVFGR